GVLGHVAGRRDRQRQVAFDDLDEIVIAVQLEGGGRHPGALLARGHSLQRVFFLDDGTLTGMASAVTPQDEQAPLQQWVALAESQQTELILCISSALKRGLLDSVEATRHQRPAATVHTAFELGGLGLLLESAQTADRLVTFG
ncbi:MAG: sulfurtransferase complex subunit TusD, partial [Haliea sp.]